jgi:hypothetical protein
VRDAFDITMDGVMDTMRRIKNEEDVVLKGYDVRDEAMAANDSCHLLKLSSLCVRVCCSLMTD